MAGELPVGEWPLPSGVPSRENVFDYIEFFYRVISVPDGTWHDFFRHWDYRTFNSEQARFEYETRLNQYLKNCGHPYDFAEGQITASLSPILDSPMREEEFALGDQYLQSLLESAVKDFLDKSRSKKLVALQTLVDAYERLKSMEDPSNKRRSVETLIAKVSAIEAVRGALNEDMKILTDVANDFTIRHHEASTRELNDDDYIEYLFYGYYNVIRLILKKYGQIR